MRSAWCIPNLPAGLQRAYLKLSSKCWYITCGKERLIVYSGRVSDVEAEVTELIRLGLVKRRKIGHRAILLLGTWKIVEEPFTSVEIRESAVFTADMTPLLERYDTSQRRLIELAFTAFGSTRKGGSISPTLLLRSLQSYTRFPAEAVAAGLRLYLEGGHAEVGKREQYALGIIRGCARDIELHSSTANVVAPLPEEVDDRVEQIRTRQVEARVAHDQAVLETAQRMYGDAPLCDLPPGALMKVVRQVESKERDSRGSS